MAKRDRDLVDKLLQVIHQHGGVVEDKGLTRGGHRFIAWSMPNGVKRRAVYASTFALVGRTYLNTVAMIKRMCRTED